MEKQIDQILGFLRHEKEEVRKQAISAFMQLSGSPEYYVYLRKEGIIKAITSCLYDHKFVNTALLTLVNLSSDPEIVEIMVEKRTFSSLLQIIFNVMKIADQLVTKKDAKILVEEKMTTIREGDVDKEVKELKVNTGEKVHADDAVAVLNKENLKLSLYVIGNMVGLSKAARDQFLEGKDGEKFKGNHFLVLLGWYSMSKYELIFEPFSSILNALTQEEDIRTFLLSPEIKLEQRLKKFLIHENNAIRLATQKTMKHLMFSHENDDLQKRFCAFEEDEAHTENFQHFGGQILTNQVLELNTRSLYMLMNKAFTLKDEHKVELQETLGEFWSPIKSKKGEQNFQIVIPGDEIEIVIEFLLVSTNIDYKTYYSHKLFDLEMIKKLCKVLEILTEYCPVHINDKINAIISLYSNELNI